LFPLQAARLLLPLRRPSTAAGPCPLSPLPPCQAVAKVTLDPALGADGGSGSGSAREGVKTDVWSPGPRCIMNEPLFVPRQGERAGAGARQGPGAGAGAGAGAAVGGPLGAAAPQGAICNSANPQPPPPPPPGATGEDDGYVLVAVHDAATGKGDLAILDARQLSAGPVATIHLPHHLPAGLHGSFSPEVHHEDGPAVPKWVEPAQIKQI
jgi:hypothetical protein